MLFKSDAQISAYLSKKCSSQSKPLLLMLNGDYAAEILGSGINAREMEGQCPLVRHYSRAACTLFSLEWSVSHGQAADQSSTWRGTCLATGFQSFSFITPMENFRNFHACLCF